MLSQRKTYAGRIKHPDDATEPATLDPPGSIAHLFRARSEIQDVCRFALQWEVVHEAAPADFAQFHIVTNGNCLLTYGDSALIRVRRQRPLTAFQSERLRPLPWFERRPVRCARESASAN